MSLGISNLNNADLFNPVKLSINNFARNNPLASIVLALALSILAFNTLSAGTLTGLLVGSVFAFNAFTITNHIISNREDFADLIKYSLMSLRTSSYEERMDIELEAQVIRDRIAQRD